MTEEKEYGEKVLDALKSGEAKIIETTDLDNYLWELEEEMKAVTKAQEEGKKWVVNVLWGEATFVSMKGDDELKETFQEFWMPKQTEAPKEAPTPAQQ